MRDPTRGGLGATLCEWAEESSVDLVVRQEALPIREDVRAACGLLGLDPMGGDESLSVGMDFFHQIETVHMGVPEVKANPDGRA